MKVSELIEFLQKYCLEDEKILYEEIELYTGSCEIYEFDIKNIKRSKRGNLLIVSLYSDIVKNNNCLHWNRLKRECKRMIIFTLAILLILKICCALTWSWWTIFIPLILIVLYGVLNHISGLLGEFLFALTKK